MPSDSGPGIPGFFIAFFVLVVLLGIGSFIWRVSVARKIAQNAGLDPDKAAAVTMLTNDGLGAAYLASTLASRPSAQPAQPVGRTQTTEERLQELQSLKDKGLISQDEYDASREKILGSI